MIDEEWTGAGDWRHLEIGRDKRDNGCDLPPMY
jgi:hypothetical protein